MNKFIIPRNRIKIYMTSDGKSDRGKKILRAFLYLMIFFSRGNLYRVLIDFLCYYYFFFSQKCERLYFFLLFPEYSEFMFGNNF